MSDEKRTVDTEQASDADVVSTVTHLLRDLGAEWEITTMHMWRDKDGMPHDLPQTRRALIVWLDEEVSDER